MDCVCQVAVPVPLHQCFDYRWLFEVAPQAGMRVDVPFGRRQLRGVVVSVGPGSGDPAKLKSVAQWYPGRALADHQLELAAWCARYYHHPPGEVMAAMVPSAWDRPATAPNQLALTSPGRQALAENRVRGARQIEALAALREGPASRADLRTTQISSAVLRRLLARNWIEEVSAAPAAPERRPGPQLSAEQQSCVDQVRAGTGFSSYLLAGVTGSGKTEVYLALIEPIVAAGDQALVIVPEIGLTPQLSQRFRSRLGPSVVVLHSSLSDPERARRWRQAAAGEAQVVIGTRSAVFCPLPRGRLIVVDEEHDLSLKQQDGFRYSARDVGVRRAQMLDIPILLGSATPSLESLHNAAEGRYRQLSLTRRPRGVSLPSVRLLDTRGLGQGDALAQESTLALEQCLAKGQQALLFLNRRGFAPALICDACGWTADCSRCDARFTLHRRDRNLRCHHCGNSRPEPRACPECGSTRLIPLGLGTQRLEQTVSARFPNVPIWRMDRDAVRSRARLTSLLDEVQAGDRGILVGTQMLAKGHDFPNVTLVVVINLDYALYSSDFRATERAAQLLVQVAGRAGRAEQPGEVLVQTHQPDHPMFRRVLGTDYLTYASELLAERRAAAYPPCGYMALLRAEAHQQATAEGFVRAALRLAPQQSQLDLLGPLPSPMERRAGRYRMQALLTSTSRGPIQSTLTAWLPQVAKLPEARKVRWSIDVDPQEMF
ncbi:MAG: primosomal protein N' [Pseudomonadota bacterium]